MCNPAHGLVRVHRSGKHEIFATHAGSHKIVTPNYAVYDSGGNLYGTTTNGDYWQSMTEAVVRCYLHAAALTGRPARELLAWSVFAVVASPSHSTVEISRPRFDELLTTAACSALARPCLIDADGAAFEFGFVELLDGLRSLV